jgi:Na+-transporting methylmalonyl-CoA/oxaloacetate decarboxylase gamma subunit
MAPDVVIVVAAAVATVAILALAVWLIGRVEARHEASEREAKPHAPPVLGGAPRHLRRHQPPT